MRRLVAITRELSPSIERCELTHVPRQSIDFEIARAQHHSYCRALHNLGVEVRVLPRLPDLPDAVFVEDPAVVVDEVAVIARMGVASRQPEVESLAHALAEFRPLELMASPGTLEGGDVLRIEKTLYVGLSNRTNHAGAEQLRHLLEPFGYRVIVTQMGDCLHLKSACSFVGQQTVLINPRWIDSGLFTGFELVEVDPAEPHAANALLVGETVLHPTEFPKTRARIEARGHMVRAVDHSELLKAESGLTCMSQIFRG